MRRIISIALLSGALAVPMAWAEDESSASTMTEDNTATEVETESSDQAPGEVPTDTETTIIEEDSMVEGEPGAMGEEPGAEQPGEVTVREEEEVAGGHLEDEVVGFKPQIGTVVYDENVVADESTSRAAFGFTVEMNAMSAIDKNLKQWYLGPVTGLIYSHLGSPGSNFFGTDAPTNNNAGANFFLVPVNLKLGYTFGRDFRVAAHGGGNLIYRSIPSSMVLDSGDAALNDDEFKMYPNVGADFEFGLGKNVALLLRPDWTLAPENDVFTGTLAIAIPLG
jgi:hypothetical protein